ncbi:MAG: amino acid adenylation domain-containing protein, partial [Acutalibacteraceae bacterium]|nr:amino acid adenylation domain-containing protein [Acutalibacteraceae bacterium]
GVMGEICIAGDSVAAGYLNRPEQTQEKFINNPFGEGKLYRTGDNGYWREDGNIVFVGRSDFQVKIRGLRIELGEIESAIQAVEGIDRAVVVVRKDSSDRQLICAFCTGKEISSKKLREELGRTLPKYMVPHIFTFLSEMPLTASGKADRKALPEIDLENISTRAEYIAPATEKEILLAGCICDVLGAEKVSVLDNFFDIGGDSLKAIELTAKLEEKGYTAEIKTIFSCKDIRELSEKLTEKEAEYEKISYGSVLPATAAQMRIYTAQMMKPDSAHYNIPAAFNVEEINHEKLEEALNKLIERHESLRTRFENRNGQIVQIIEDKAEIQLQKLDSDDISVFNTPFDLEKAPLIKAGYYGNTVMLVMHHIITDGESMAVLYKELNELYMGRELNDAVQYGEFAVTDGYTEDNEKYWLSAFSDIPAPLELRTDFVRPEVQSFNGSEIYEFIDIETHNRITEKCKEKGITPFVYYMACLSILLSKFSGNEDIVIGTPVSGRTAKHINTVGMFVNTLALRSRPYGDKKIYELMEEIKEGSISAIDNQSYPFGELVKKLNISSTGRNPLFDVMFSYQREQTRDIIFGDSKANALPVPLSGAKCDIGFYIIPRDTDVVFLTEYCSDLFKKETLSQITEKYIRLLELCLNDDQYIKDISLADADVINSFNSTAHSYDIPNTSTLYSLFENTAKENKDKTCIKIAEKNISFSELLNISEKLDTRIREITKGEKSVIAVIAERSAEMYASVYGIIRGGNAYLPIDPDYPQERIDYILENSKAKAVTAQGKFCNLAGNVPCVDMTAFIENADISEIHDCAAVPDDTAYVIYTSGSTGTPKGAKVSHKSAVNRILWMHNKYPLGKDDVILQKTPYTFDVSVWELFWWGLCGGSLACSKHGEHFLPAKILDEVHSKKVTHLHFVPSVFELFLNYLEAHSDECNKFKTVRYVFLSGEALSAALVQRFYKLFDYNKVTLHNLYGPTECAVDVTYYDCSPADTDPVPIGNPVYNTQMYIVDKHMNPVPVGVMGEICIAGDNVGQGYLNNPDLTAEKFIDNPFGEGKLYRTGDNGYWREDGNIVFVGRTDGLIKLNGQRIETGEIEAVISSVSGVYSAAVIVKKVNDMDVLVAFYTGKINCEESIKEHCLNRLPKYMVPSAIKHLDCLPINQNGKLDRKKLTEIHISYGQPNKNDEPTNETEAKICKIFESVLEADNIGRSSNFFDIGGSSISMISVLSEEGFENITAAEFIRNPTPAKLAQIMLSRSIEAFEYLEPLHISENSEKAMILLPFAGGGTEVYSTFVNTLKNKNSRISVYFIRYLHSIEDCEKAADEIRTVLEGREILLYSHCVGSAVALYILNKLEKEQFTVKHYFAGASLPPERPVRNNIWNIVPDMVLKRILTKAGADFSKLSRKNLSGFLKKFRKDTNFANISFYEFNNRLKTPISIIISKTDIFTKQYAKTESLWLKYFYTVSDVHYIASDSHYFQKDNSEELFRLILRNK